MTMATGRIALDLLTRQEIERINALGERLADGLRQVFAKKQELGAVVNNCGSLVHVNSRRRARSAPTPISTSTAP
jgi:glutamate-1-semialdehyde aminotransferase